jgi:isopentenyl-diphosphate delta-isomerase
MESVVLVNENDEEVGTMEKLQAHREGRLHRAFSVLVFNSKGELLIQQRAASKYHSAGLWTNTCCSHPHPGEQIAEAAARRLSEEMGIQAKPEFLYKFTYRVNLDNDFVEHELDYVFRAVFDGQPESNPEEVKGWKFVSVEELLKSVASSPERYTHWFKLILDHQYRRLVDSPT